MIALTDTASTKVKELLQAEGQPELFLRVAVRPGGCSGFSYEMFFDGDIAQDDQTVNFGDVKVVVNNVDLSAYADSVDTPMEREQVEVSAFSPTGSRAFLPGLSDQTITVEFARPTGLWAAVAVEDADRQELRIGGDQVNDTRDMRAVTVGFVRIAVIIVIVCFRRTYSGILAKS